MPSDGNPTAELLFRLLFGLFIVAENRVQVLTVPVWAGTFLGIGAN